jgi:hypothetical protein
VVANLIKPKFLKYVAHYFRWTTVQSVIIVANFFLFIVDLSSALTAENLQTVLGDPKLVRELHQHLPSGVGGNPPPPASEQLRSTLASPQFQQVISINQLALWP